MKADWLVRQVIDWRHGHLESVLAVMICRAVCYFMLCDLDLSEDIYYEGA